MSALQGFVMMNVEELALCCGIQVSSLDEEVASEYYTELSGHLSQWKLIAPKVGLTDDEVAAIDAKSEIEKRVSFLETWKQKFATKATYRTLIESLLGIKRVEDARGVCWVLKGGEQPLHDESKEEIAEPEDKPTKGTPMYEELVQFSADVVLLLLTVTDTEYRAALSILEPPSRTFPAPVIFPMPNMVAGSVGEWKVVLIKAGGGRTVGDYVEGALKRYTSARFVIGVGVCFAFDRDQCKVADVLVSKAIRDNSYTKFEDNEIKDLGQKINIARDLQEIFCMQTKKELKFDVSKSRKSVMHCGTFCCNTFRIEDAAVRDAFHRLNTGDIGIEMEGGELMKLQQDKKVEGVIVIKGVAGFADKTETKHWEYTAAKAALHYVKAQLRNTDASLTCSKSPARKRRAIFLDDSDEEH